MFEWRAEYLVGVSVIDEQHRELFALMHALHEGFADPVPMKRGRAAFVRTLSELVSKTKVHFATEEALMGLWDYPHLAEHKQVHDNLVEQANALLESVQSRGGAGPAETLRFLGNWLAHHISAADKRFAAFIEQRAPR